MSNTVVTWAAFNNTYNNEGRAAAAKLVKHMSGSSAEIAKRVINGPTASQRQESARRQNAINAVSTKEIRAHCQFAGLPVQVRRVAR